MGILGILVAKSFRVSIIFGSKVLLQIKNVTDGYVAAIVTACLAGQLVFLIVLTSLNMTWTDKLDKGSDQFVYGCNTGNGFDIWMGLEIAFIAALMLAGAVVAFRTRSVPSAFNESSHILFSLQIMLFFLVLLVPLDWALVDNSPEASVVIQGGGQLLLALVILSSNFVPKLYYIFTGKANDKSLVFAPSAKGSVSQSSEMSSMASKSNGSASGGTDSTI
jgi:hypothetical protein